jgi:hypothetical protein
VVQFEVGEGFYGSSVASLTILTAAWLGVLFAIMAAPVAAQLRKSISDVLKVGFELCAACGTSSRLRSTFDCVVDSESLDCHASSFPQPVLLRHPVEIQTAPLAGMRRFTRLTNAFSKKLENHGHMAALHFMQYNFCRVHKALRATPAMEAGLTDHVWSVAELLGGV